MRTLRVGIVVASLGGCALPAAADDGFPKVPPKAAAAAKAKSPAARAAACKAIGDLGEEGKARRRDLCEAMLDPVEAVQVAAMDAMKKVDADLHKLCVQLLIDRSIASVQTAGRLEKGAKPLVPLLMALATAAAPAAGDELIISSTNSSGLMTECVRAMAKIDPADAAVNKAVLGMLTNPAAHLRAFALGVVPSVSQCKAGFPTVLAIAAGGGTAERIVALRMLPDLCDDKTRPAAVKLVESLRYDKTPAVREAAAETLKKFE